MVRTSSSTITIIGAGLAGCFFATLLAKRGYKVEIYEGFSKNEIANIASKRSFNLTFYGYAIEALKAAGLWQEIEPFFLKLKGSLTYVTKDSAPVFVRFDYNSMTYYTIQRARLLEILIKQALQEPLITFHFNTALLAINRQEKTIIVQNFKTKVLKTIACEVIVGADGINSHVRACLQQGQQTQHKQEYENWSYKQIVITKEMAKKIPLQKDTQHVWTKKYASLIVFPNGDESFTGMLILPKNTTHGFASLTSKVEIKNFVTHNFPNFLPVLSFITDPLLTNPQGSLVTVYTTPWYYKDFMVLIGDAAHGCLPFYGVGTSVAFGDCMEIAKQIDTYGKNWGEIFPKYQAARKRHTDTIATLAKESFVRLRRHKKADYAAIYDRVEAFLHTAFPRFFHPPLFYLVANNVNHAADHYLRHKQQRKLAKFLGISLLVKILTVCVSIYESTRSLRIPTPVA